MKIIIDWMKSLCPISDETIRELEACVTPCHFPKRTLLVREGIYCKYAYFIEKGMTRSYWLVDGEEYTTSFAGDGCIVFSMDELYYNQVSQEFVETLEEVEAYRILITDLRRLWETNLELSNWGRIIHAVGYSGTRVREEKIDIDIAGLPACRGGEQTDTPSDDLRERVQAKEFTVRINLNLGNEEYVVYTTDLSPEYVDFNRSEYAYWNQAKQDGLTK